MDGHFFDLWRIRLSQEVKQMERKRFARLSQRLGALLLAGATLWTVYATAGSVDAAGAWMAVKRELPLALLQWQLGDMGQRDGLSAPSVLMLSQAPILLSARGEISDLRRQAAEEPEDERPAPVTQPVREEPQPAPVTAGADNGVTAKTLIPTDPSGYTVCGKVYIRNTTQYTLSNEELLKPFAAELTGEAPQILILHATAARAIPRRWMTASSGPGTTAPRTPGTMWFAWGTPWQRYLLRRGSPCSMTGPCMTIRSTPGPMTALWRGSTGI